MAPQPLWPAAGTIGAIWNGPQGMDRDCLTRLERAGPADEEAGAATLLVSAAKSEAEPLRAGPADEEAGAATLPVSAPKSEAEPPLSEAEFHSMSETSGARVCDRLPLLFRLLEFLLFLFYLRSNLGQAWLLLLRA